jgi:uncharacterized protein YcbX
MRVAELWRYPVKSVGGERLTTADLTELGVPFDRGWGVVDDHTGNVLTARREPHLLMATARVNDDAPVITTVDGDELRTSAELSAWLDRPVTLRSAAGRDGGTYEVPLDFERDAQWVSWQGPPDAWHDSTRARVSLLSVDTLGDWDVRRFRPNVVLTGGGEDDLVGAEVTLGGARLTVEKPIDRCVMVTRPQPGLPRDLDVLRAINRDRDTTLAVGALVRTPGPVAVGDELRTV